MASEAPPFWWEAADWRAWSLSPLSALYGLVAGYRMASAKRAKVDVPVLCVGNFTVGGEGKTPVSIALAKQAKKLGRKPGFLTRGHGGSMATAHLVDAKKDLSRHVGDEPLLLARHAPTLVAPDRLTGARELIGIGCDFIIMDDGFQSARLHMDYAVMVVDARRGLGNGHVIPGGPLRARLIDQLRHADAILTMGAGNAADLVVRKASRAGRPVFQAGLKARGVRAIKGGRFLAFAGIGNPKKFFDSVTGAGGAVVEGKSFPDHHPYDDDDARDLIAAAEKGELQLITTEKDLVRLRGGSEALSALADHCRVLQVEAAFDAPDMPVTIIESTIEAWRVRMLK
ncbi:tetraacyldisaccharide 4'-kinase [Nitratireductor aquibiodomus]|uniref:tetraacyldisaccharide 4'-kinase n=1 Tax=Nitratireductor aquibiodomus TaxID=204799 RepID=UPI0004697A0A|nr:tetraacyldisaccharide 4'-kinase [Nitratireductor aquibiodomus]